jgi:hypothetical protein
VNFLLAVQPKPKNLVFVIIIGERKNASDKKTGERGCRILNQGETKSKFDTWFIL